MSRNNKIVVNPLTLNEGNNAINETNNDTTTVVSENNNITTPTVEKAADEKQARSTAKKLKENQIKIKIPVDPLNPKDLMVPVVINGYQWLIKRGESVTVPEEVARILEEAKYI